MSSSSSDSESDREMDHGESPAFDVKKATKISNLEEFQAMMTATPPEELPKIIKLVGENQFEAIMGFKKKEEKQPIKKRKKSEPQELSAKTRLRQKLFQGVKIEAPRDPRFDDLSGTLDMDRYNRNYGFLNEMKEKERMKIKKAFDKEKDPERKQELRRLLNRYNNDAARFKQQTKVKETKKVVKEQSKKLVKEGKNPFFLKKSELKMVQLAEKFKELKQSGKLADYLKKKEKKLAKKGLCEASVSSLLE